MHADTNLQTFETMCCFHPQERRFQKGKTFPEDGGRLHGVTTQKIVILVVIAKDLEPGVLLFQFTQSMSVPFVSVLLFYSECLSE
jgi:hypothetical protein